MATNQLIVSYSREDNEHPVDAAGDGWGKTFVKGLERRHDRDLGHRRGVFFDGESIEEATDWRSRLDKRIRQLRLLFVFLSPTSVTPMKCPFDWGESRRCEHYAAHGDDGLKPIDLVAPDDLRRAESETIADWLQAMERDYPSFTVRDPRATPGAQRVGKRVAAALARHNVTSNLPFHPLSGKGSDVLRERIRHQPECYCPEDDPPELKRADFLELPETNGLAWTDDRASRTAYDWEHRHNTVEDKPDCRRQTRVGTLIGWSMQRLSTEARRALELASLFMPDEIPNERVRHLTPKRHPDVNDTALDNDHDWPGTWRELRGLRMQRPERKADEDDRGIEPLPSGRWLYSSAVSNSTYGPSTPIPSPPSPRVPCRWRISESFCSTAVVGVTRLRFRAWQPVCPSSIPSQN